MVHLQACATSFRPSEGQQLRQRRIHQRPHSHNYKIDHMGVHLGKLITVHGIVTQVSEVKPLLLVNAYTCDVCGSETFQEISRKEFTPIADCQNENECMRNNIKDSLHMQTRACRFSPLQEVKLQEMPDASGICLRFLMTVVLFIVFPRQTKSLSAISPDP
jgi:DNA replicative helicase MCM subunit Mcm2 (Cdc46/Mcm family)